MVGVINISEQITMEKKDLFEGEEIITQSDENTIVLTNIRIRYSDIEYSRASIVSIMLEKVSSIEAYFSSNLYLLMFGVLGTLFGVITMYNHTNNEYSVLALIVGLILIAAYFSSRKYLIVISPDGGSQIRFHAKGMKKETVFDFINKVERAADTRRRNLNSKNGVRFDA